MSEILLKLFVLILAWKIEISSTNEIYKLDDDLHCIEEQMEEKENQLISLLVLNPKVMRETLEQNHQNILKNFEVIFLKEDSSSYLKELCARILIMSACERMDLDLYTFYLFNERNYPMAQVFTLRNLMFKNKKNH